MRRFFKYGKWQRVLWMSLLASPLLTGMSASVDGRFWLNSETPVSVNLNAVAAHGKGYALAVGGEGTVLEFRDGSWKRVPEAEQQWNAAPLSAAVVLRPDNILIGSAARTVNERGVSMWDGGRWGPIINAANVNSRQRVHAMWGDARSGVVIAALQSGRVTRLDGGMWSNIINLGEGDLLAVHGSALNNIWVVGAGGQIHRSTDAGITWKTFDQLAETPYADTHWNGVYTLGQDRTWIVGNGGEIAFWDGNTFSVVQPTTQILRDIYAIDGNNVYAVGSAPGANQGTLLYYNGTEWQRLQMDASVSSATWYSIAGDEEGRIWIVGNNGRILTSVPEPPRGSGFFFWFILLRFSPLNRKSGTCRTDNQNDFHRSRQRLGASPRGFSLVELLSAMAVIVVIAAITIGVLKGTRQTADTVVCQTNMRSIGLAIALYVNDNNGYVPGPVSGGQKLGYSSARYSDRYHLPRLLAAYLEIPEPAVEPQFAQAMACPGWLANLGPSGDRLTTPAYLARGTALMLDGTTVNPWGYSTHGTLPHPLHQIAYPEKTAALMDIDSTVVPGWAGQIPVAPVHAGYQNALFWDFHVERIRFEDL